MILPPVIQIFGFLISLIRSSRESSIILQYIIHMFERLRQQTKNLLTSKRLNEQTRSQQPIAIPTRDVLFQLSQSLLAVGEKTYPIPTYIREEIEKSFQWKFAKREDMPVRTVQQLNQLTLTPILNELCQVYFGRLLQLMIQINPLTSGLYQHKDKPLYSVVEQLLKASDSDLQQQISIISTYLNVLKQQDNLLYIIQFQEVKRRLSVRTMEIVRKLQFQIQRNQIGNIIFYQRIDKQADKKTFITMLSESRLNEAKGRQIAMTAFSEFAILKNRMNVTFGKMVMMMKAERSPHLERFFSSKVMPGAIKQTLMRKVYEQLSSSEYNVLE